MMKAASFADRFPRGGLFPQARAVSLRTSESSTGETEGEEGASADFRPARRTLQGILVLLSAPLWIQAIFPSWLSPRWKEGVLSLGLFCILCLVGTWLFDIESQLRRRNSPAMTRPRSTEPGFSTGKNRQEER
jgi:hypothetical protein